MFIYYYVQIDRPFESVEPRLMHMLPGLHGWAEEAYRDGEHLRARIGPGARVLAKEVDLAVGEPMRGGGETWIPVAWEATGLSVLFPRMEADLVVAAVGPELTQIAFRGSYRPPLGAVGAALDRTLLHRIAEATVRSFLERLATALERDAVAPSGRGRP